MDFHRYARKFRPDRWLARSAPDGFPPVRVEIHLAVRSWRRPGRGPGRRRPRAGWSAGPGREGRPVRRTSGRARSPPRSPPRSPGSPPRSRPIWSWRWLHSGRPSWSWVIACTAVRPRPPTITPARAEAIRAARPNVRLPPSEDARKRRKRSRKPRRPSQPAGAAAGVATTGVSAVAAAGVSAGAAGVAGASAGWSSGAPTGRTGWVSSFMDRASARCLWGTCAPGVSQPRLSRTSRRSMSRSPGRLRPRGGCGQDGLHETRRPTCRSTSSSSTTAGSPPP